MIEVHCALCGQNNYSVLSSHRNDKYLNNLEVEVRTVICKVCGLVYVNPQIPEDERYTIYSTDYGRTRHGQISQRELRARDYSLGRTARWIDKQLNLSSKIGKVLDIGCAAGSLLIAFKKYGWDVYGIEPTPHWAEIARERCGGNIITCFLEDADLPRSYFDMVTLTQTLEHMPDPVQTLDIIKGLLKDDGILYLDVPNVLKPKNFEMFVATHLYSFSPNTLRLMLRKTGFKIIRIENTWNILTIARKDSSTENIDFSADGDDWQKVSRNLKWGYVRLVVRRSALNIIRLATGTIRLIFGESRGSRIIYAIREFLHWA